MGKKDPRTDAFIAKSADFAKPILIHLRKLVHSACPDTEETLKWRMPAFMYQGKILCIMGAFKAHAVFGFWKVSITVDGAKAGVKADPKPGDGMGHFGKLTSLKDLPPDKTMLGYIKAAMRLSGDGAGPGARVKKAKPKPKPPLEAPKYFLAAVKKDKRAWACYQAFPPGQKREYVDWITEAKTDATRDSRLATAVAWMAEGKTRLWKYKK